MWGFDSLKDVLDVLVVPVALAIIALLWPRRDAARRRSEFERMMLREIEECGPYPAELRKGQKWTDLQSKEFVHQRILSGPAGNQEFILSLDPDVLYWSSQMWDARRSEDKVQWDYYLGRLAAHYSQHKELKEVADKWKAIPASAQYPVVVEALKGPTET